MLPARYLGLIGDTGHQLVPSLVAAVVYGVGFGLLMAGWQEWGRRQAERDEE
jgi:hypothetical protein